MTKQNYLKLKKELTKELLVTTYNTCDLVVKHRFNEPTWTKCQLTGLMDNCFETELLFFDLEGNYTEAIDFGYINVNDFIDFKNDEIEEVA